MDSQALKHSTAVIIIQVFSKTPYATREVLKNARGTREIAFAAFFFISQII